MFKSGLKKGLIIINSMKLFFATALLGATAYATSSVNQLLAQIQATAEVEAEAGDCKSCGACRCKYDWLVSGSGIDEHGKLACTEVTVEHLNTKNVEIEGVAKSFLDFDDECCAPKIQVLLNILLCRTDSIDKKYEEIENHVLDEIAELVEDGDEGPIGPKGDKGPKGE